MVSSEACPKEASPNSQSLKGSSAICEADSSLVVLAALLHESELASLTMQPPCKMTVNIMRILHLMGDEPCDRLSHDCSKHLFLVSLSIALLLNLASG